MKYEEKFVELFKLICDRFDGAPLGKKATQKIFYFFERKGIILNLKYGIHYYGPYSSKLDNTMHILESKNYISIDTSRSTHVISLCSNTSVPSVLLPEEREIVESVLDELAHKSPLELEALATMDYIYNSLIEHKNKNNVLSMFKSIKGDKFDDNMINNAYDELVGFNLIQ